MLNSKFHASQKTCKSNRSDSRTNNTIKTSVEEKGNRRHEIAKSVYKKPGKIEQNGDRIKIRALIRRGRSN